MRGKGEGHGRIVPRLFLLRIRNNVKNEKQIFNRLFITLHFYPLLRILKCKTSMYHVTFIVFRLLQAVLMVLVPENFC